MAVLAAGALAALAGGGCGEEAEAGRALLRVTNWGSPAVVSDFLKMEDEFSAQFEGLFPECRVRIEQIPGIGQYAPKLLMMHVADAMPDVLQFDASSGAVFIDNGVLLDLAPLIAADPVFRLEDFFETVTDSARRGERVYAIPLDFTPMMMYYNRKLFAEAGVEFPRAGWTWDEFLETARRIRDYYGQRGGPRVYGMQFENVMPFWILWLWTNGGDVLTPDGKRAKGALDSPESIAALHFIVDLIQEHRVAPSPAELRAAGVDLFRAGRAAMDLKGHWMWLDYRADGMDIGVVALPTTGGRRVTVAYQSGLAIAAKTRQPRLAWEYVKFMTSEAVQVRRVGSGLAISGNKRAAAHFAGDPIEDAFLAEVPYARPPWGARVERYPYIEDLGQEMMDDILTAGVPVEQAVARTTALIDAALAEP